jgi:hypothetical protein
MVLMLRMMKSQHLNALLETRGEATSLMQIVDELKKKMTLRMSQSNCITKTSAENSSDIMVFCL